MKKNDELKSFESLSYADAVLEMTPNLVVYLDTENRVKKISKTTRQLLGLDPSLSYQGVSIFDIIKNQVLTLLTRKWLEKLNKGESIDETFPIDWEGNNQYEWYQIRGSPLELEGKIAGKIFFITDVSILYSHKKLLDTLLISSPGDVFVFDRNYQILVVSDSVARENGFVSWRDLVGLNLRDLRSINMSFIEKILETSILTNEPVNEVVKFITPKNELRWVYLDLRTINSTAGVFGYIMTSFDITREIQPKVILEALMESTSDAIAIVNTEGILEYVSQPLVKTLGFHDWKTVVNKPWSFLFRNTGNQDSQFSELFSEVSPGSRTGTISIGSGESVQFYNYRKDTLHYQEQIFGVISIASNTTELVQARERAEDGIRAKAAFLANMSHELRTPMNAVLGMNELLSRTSLNALQKNYSEHIRSSATMLLSIINDILDFSRIEDSKVELNIVEYSVTSMLHDVINLVNVKAAEKELSFTVDIEPSLPSQLLGDELRIKQILVNLLNNAVKFTDSGEVNLAVSAVHSKDQNSVWVSFRIRDTGSGIPQDKQSELFERFNRIETNRTRDIEGSGLGLAITKGLLSLMHGTITLESDEGAGSTFIASFNQSVPANAGPLAEFRLSSTITMLVFDRDLYVIGSIRQMASYGAIKATFCSTAEEFSILLAQKSRQWTHVVFEYSAGYERAMNSLSAHPKTRWLAMLSMTDFMGKGKHEVCDFTFKPLLVSTFSRFTQGERVDFSEARRLENLLTFPALCFRAPEAHVLVVDDSAVNRKVIQGFLQTLDIQSEEAENGLEAIKKASVHAYDLILMDHLMPGMDGVEATEKLRLLNGYRDVPIIALTANAGLTYEQTYLRAGMNATLYKPIDFNIFIRCLKKWLPVHTVQNYDNSESCPCREIISDGESTLSGEVEQSLQVQRAADSDEPNKDWILGLNVETGIRYTGSRESLEKILKLFIKTGPKMLEQLETGRKSGSATQFRTAVHSLISSGANIGADTLSACARDLEQAIIAGETETCDKLYPQLHENLKNLISAVKAYFEID